MENKQVLQQNVSHLLSTRRRQSIVLGITGGSGSGKSTIAKIIENKLADFRVNIVHLDQFFFPIDEMPTYYSNYLGKNQPNFNHPGALDFCRMIQFCRTLEEYELHILDGHFALYKKEMRKLMDVKCFITLDIHEMLERRTVRNLQNNYGGDEANIRHYNQECVVPMYKKYIFPCSAYADVLIPNRSTERVERDIVIDILCDLISKDLADKARMEN